jgi:hypothetical protein
MSEQSAYSVGAGTEWAFGPALAPPSAETTLPRHLKITGVAPALGYERCEDLGCSVELDGTATSCGRLACPSCGCGGTNLTTTGLLDGDSAARIHCSCGFAWEREAPIPRTLAGIAYAG